MHHYTTSEIHAFALLLFFSGYFFWKAIRLWKYFRKRSLLSRNKTLKKLKRLSWDDFELFCKELFEREGWKVKGNSQKGADGGVDLWMSRHSTLRKNTTAIVQCKRYDETRVTIKVIREMYGLMYEYEADKAFIVTTSAFTKECYAFVEGKNIELINGNTLLKMIN